MNLISISFNSRCLSTIQIYSEGHLTNPQGMAWHTFITSGFIIYRLFQSVNKFTTFQGTPPEKTLVLSNFDRDKFCFLH